MTDKEKNYYKKLRNISNFLLQNPEKNIFEIENIKKTDEYKNDLNLQIIIAAVENMPLILRGDFKTAISNLNQTISKANELGVWIVLPFCYNLLGTVYFHLAFFDKAYYSYNSIIHIEEEHNIHDMQSIAYNNIGVLFEHLGDAERAVEYFGKSLKLDMRSDLNDPAKLSSFIITAANYVIELCKKEDGKNAKLWLKRMEKHNFDTLNLIAVSAVYEAYTYYYIQIKDFEKSSFYYSKLKSTFESGLSTNEMYRALANYAKFCQLRNVPYEHYINKIQEYENNDTYEFSDHLSEINCVLNSYYTDIGNTEKIISSFRNYMRFSEINKTNNKDRQLKALDVIIDNLQIMKENAVMREENTWLNKLTGELEKANETLELVGKRLNIVTEIGRKITASLDLDEIIKVIYDFILEVISVDSFVIFIINEKKNELQSIKLIEEGVVFENISVPLSNKKSYAIQCYCTSSAITVSDVTKETNIQKIERGNGANKFNISSAMFIPITYDGKTIGVFSLQSKIKNFFNSEHETFLNSIGQYLAIAINNVKYSQKLKNEIESHKKTQTKLKKANKELKKLAVLDELTQIYNRREFYDEYLKFIELAIHSKLPLNVLMMDIDNFKKLNDTYGHLIGDKALVAVAGTIKKVITNKNSIIARFGGEEFIAVSVGEDEKEIR